MTVNEGKKNRRSLEFEDRNAQQKILRTNDDSTEYNPKIPKE
jgi:hypothetical protein